MYHPIGLQLQIAITNPAPVASVGRIARQAEETYGETAPGVAVRALSEAAGHLRYQAAHEPDTASTVFELTIRERKYMELLSFQERIWRLSRDPLPLDTEIQMNTSMKGETRKITEFELLLETWHELNNEVERVKDWKYEVGFASIQPQDYPSDAAGQLRYQEEKTRNHAAAERNNYVSYLRNKGTYFTNRVIEQTVRAYAATPNLVTQLQEVMDGYLPPEVSTNVMNKVFAAMKPEVVAKTPRPVPGAKGERWLRAPPPAPEPSVPAVARPSKLRERLAAQGKPGMVAVGAAGGVPASGAEGEADATADAHGTAVWVWAALGFVALAGGWVWLRQRS